MERFRPVISLKFFELFKLKFMPCACLNGVTLPKNSL